MVGLSLKHSLVRAGAAPKIENPKMSQMLWKNWGKEDNPIAVDLKQKGLREISWEN